MPKNDINTIDSFDSKVISSKLLEISEFSTNKYNYNNIIVLKSKERKFGMDIPLTGSIKLVKFSGNIKAGIDFDKIKIEKEENGDTILLKVPKSRILENNIDSNNVVIENVEDGILSNDVSQKIIDSINKTKLEIEKQIIKDGFLNKSDKRAQEILSTFMRQMGFKKVVFEII
jgi:hypothetical protein